MMTGLGVLLIVLAILLVWLLRRQATWWSIALLAAAGVIELVLIGTDQQVITLWVQSHTTAWTRAACLLGGVVGTWLPFRKRHGSVAFLLLVIGTLIGHLFWR